MCMPVLERHTSLMSGIPAWYAIKAYQDQSKQTRILLDQMIRDIEYRRLGQASWVFVWLEDRPYDGNPDAMRASCIGNTSNQPLYNIVSAAAGCVCPVDYSS